MKLLTKEIINKFPGIKETESKKPNEVNIIAKFFHPFSDWTWYATEANAVLENGEEIPLKEAHAKNLKYEDVLFFGLVRGFENELGYFSLSELESVKVRGLGMERDRFFKNHTLAEAQEKRI